MKILFFIAFVLATAVAKAQDLRIFHIDVDQGDATLFVSPNGSSLLVDSGKNGHGPRLRAAMQSAGITQIDHLVITHYHEDHYGGADELVTDAPEITVVNVHDRGDKSFLKPGKTAQATYVDYDSALGHRAHHLMRGETIALDPDMMVTCVSSGSAVIGEDPVHHGADENDMSISLLIQFGDFRYFVGGDIESHTEEKIADRNLVTDVDIYQSNHHGSRTSSTISFIQDLMPTVVVISNGNHGGHKHPQQVTLDNYANLTPAPTVFQTNKYLKGGTGGNVDDQFIADLDADGGDGTILVTVQSNGAFIAEYRGVTRTFQSKPRGTAGPTVAIVSLLPDPVGNDRNLEQVELQNNHSGAVNLTGWMLRDESGRVWSLTPLGEIGAGDAETIVRNGMAMSLDNDGDTIELIDPSGSVIDEVSYPAAATGETINF